MPIIKTLKRQAKQATNRILLTAGIQLISAKKYERLSRQKLLQERIINQRDGSSHTAPGTARAKTPLFAFYRYGILEQIEETKENYFWMTHDKAGIFSCLTTVMWTALEATAEGRPLHKIDNSFSMSCFKERSEENTWGMLFKQKSKTEIERIIKTPPISTKKFNQHGDYATILKRELGEGWVTEYLNAYMTPTPEVEDRAHFFINKYKIIEKNTIAICFRGTDKYKEVAPSPVSEYFKAIDLILTNENSQVLIQTDQEQVRAQFLQRYASKCIFIEEIPVVKGRKAVHNETALSFNRYDFSVNLYAMCLAISKSKYVLTHTGNVGFFLAIHALLAGSKVIQFDLGTK